MAYWMTHLRVAERCLPLLPQGLSLPHYYAGALAPDCGITETGENGIIGGADNDTAPGGTTGDFDSTDSDTAARDTTNDTTRDTTRDTTGDTGSDGPMESAIDSAADGAADMVDQATDGTNIWGIVIAIVVIVAVGVLIFAFMPRKK